MQIVRRAANASIVRKPLYEIEPEEFDMKPIKGRVAIWDTETDPFAEGRIVKPFTCGFYIPDSDEYFDFWGDDCIAQFFAFLASSFPEETFTIFVHNGGNFDCYFIVDYFDEGMTPFIINGRLVRITAQGHEFRDSYAMIPVALGNALKADDGGKIEIDYSKFECEVREDNKTEILIYQRQDCIALGKLVVEWLAMFGNRLTMASVALPMLRSFHGFENMSEQTDDNMRCYYFGGRCQAFELGVLRGEFYGYDINSSYPDSMRRLKHPISNTTMYEKAITPRTHFARIRAWSNGALPVRADNGGLEFPIGVRDFYACIHEIRAGLETGTLRIHRVYETVYFTHESTFDNFIDTFYKRRLEAGANGDEVRKLFYKLVMNSSYGKFAQDPRKYESWLFDPVDIPSPLLCEVCHEIDIGKVAKIDGYSCAKCESKTHDAYGWYLHTEHSGKHIYARPQKVRAGSGFFNVATAASITSAARASLLRGISSANRPIYCDTDSIICEALDAELDDKKLGAWKEEFQADTLCIAGKKLYAVFSEGLEIKKASKGVKLTGDEIRRICEGETIEYANPVPKFKLDGTAQFITRKIKRTGKVLVDEEKVEVRSFRFS